MLPIETIKRTHTCGELRAADVGKTVTLNGWVHRWRDLGGLKFIDLRDRYGLTQIVFDPDALDAETFKIAAHLRMETVIGVEGTIGARPDGTVNANLDTGEVELRVTRLVVLNVSETPPFEIEEDSKASEDLRLEYRYLDLRRGPLQRRMQLRHDAAQATREYLISRGFLEIETPQLIRSTPEGARDYVVPSRVHKGRFYALPQSPQLFKQILMVSGYDRYFQLARCLRDEDLRADRQPEHTQIDLEMSFVTSEDVWDVIEGTMCHLWKTVLDIEIPRPFPRFTFDEVMDKYGSDKPDLRYGVEIVDFGAAVKDCGFKVFTDAVGRGDFVRGIVVPGGAKLSRREVGEYEQIAKDNGAFGMAYLLYAEDGVKGPIAKFLEPSDLDKITAASGVKVGDAIFFVAANKTVVREVLGQLRRAVAKDFDLVDRSRWEFMWVHEFPLFEYNADADRYDAMHNIVTHPYEEDLVKLEAGFTTDIPKSSPEHPWAQIRGYQYDLVLNGMEMGSGGMRNYKPEVQRRVLNALGIDDDRARKMFGFLLDSFTYGAPPHGGIALGFDRVVALMSGTESIRDVIAFPKTTQAQSLMDGSPTEIDEDQWRELGLRPADKS